jgi:hypothetical protein
MTRQVNSDVSCKGSRNSQIEVTRLRFTPTWCVAVARTATSPQRAVHMRWLSFGSSKISTWRSATERIGCCEARVQRLRPDRSALSRRSKTPRFKLSESDLACSRPKFTSHFPDFPRKMFSTGFTSRQTTALSTGARKAGHMHSRWPATRAPNSAQKVPRKSYRLPICRIFIYPSIAASS